MTPQEKAKQEAEKAVESYEQMGVIIGERKKDQKPLIIKMPMEAAIQCAIKEYQRRIADAEKDKRENVSLHTLVAFHNDMVNDKITEYRLILAELEKL